MQDVPVFQVIDGRIFASAKDKASFDRHCAANGLRPLPIEVVWEGNGQSPQSLPLSEFAVPMRRDCN